MQLSPNASRATESVRRALPMYRRGSIRADLNPAIGEQEGSGPSSGDAGHMLRSSGTHPGDHGSDDSFRPRPGAEPVIATATKYSFGSDRSERGAGDRFGTTPRAAPAGRRQRDLDDVVFLSRWLACLLRVAACDA